MKSSFITALFCLACLGPADEPVALRAESGRFEIVRQYRGGFVETVRFRDPKVPPVELPGFSWPGTYDLSPDEKWLLRSQKTGSGDSIAVLYRIEKNGRISEVIGFDDLLWGVSDTVSRLRRRDLYHTGVDRIEWARDGRSVEIVLRGSNAARTGDGIAMRVIYDFNENQAVARSTNSDQVDADQPAADPESKPEGDEKSPPESEACSR